MSSLLGMFGLIFAAVGVVGGVFAVKGVLSILRQRTFRTEDGQDVRTQAQNSESVPAHDVGQSVEVTYDAQEPTHAYMGSGASGGTKAIVQVIGGIVFALFALGFVGGGALSWPFGGG